MKKNSHRLYAYALLILLRLQVFICHDGDLYAQDTVSLEAVEIKVEKYVHSQLGKKIEKNDSLMKSLYRFSSLGDYLSGNSMVFIKNYGPGAIATTAMRGGNASQTAILWNGFNLQNTMLGQSDLTLMPNFLFDQMVVEYGGSSSVWGSGAIGGSIHLNSLLQQNAGTMAGITLGTGSIGARSLGAFAHVSQKSFASNTKYFVHQSDNRFRYYDNSMNVADIKTAKTNAVELKGLVQDFKFWINKQQSLQLSAWIQDSRRQLAETDLQISSQTKQSDQSLRFSANWNYSRKRFSSILKSCFFQDRINYRDGIQFIESKSLTKTFMVESENYYSWFRHQMLNLSVNVLSSSATADNYAKREEMNRVSLLGSNRSGFFNNRLKTMASIRLEFYTPTQLPITGSLALEYLLMRKLLVKASAAKVYRQPTLNELYWQPGGNQNLKAEQGYTYEGEMNYTTNFNHFKFQVSLAAFSRTINDWINWVPGANGQPSPVNIQSVWSRGTETSWNLEFEKKRFTSGLVFKSSYVLSTVKSSLNENDYSVGKQLIYTPRYLFNSQVYFKVKNFSAFLFHHYTGYRFVSSDNSSWEDPYQIINVKLNYSVMFKNTLLNFFMACNNLLNENYRIISNRPMPLRNYELGIALQFKPIKKQN